MRKNQTYPFVLPDSRTHRSIELCEIEAIILLHPVPTIYDPILKITRLEGFHTALPLRRGGNSNLGPDIYALCTTITSPQESSLGNLKRRSFLLAHMGVTNEAWALWSLLFKKIENKIWKIQKI
jgi:hypothetical protein